MPKAPKIILSEPRVGLIPMFPRANWAVDVSFDYLREHVEHHVSAYKLDLEPDFQRAHVWTQDQQKSFIEYLLRGGEAGKHLYFNCPGWEEEIKVTGPYVIVDGKQRLKAAMDFMDDKFTAFGWHASQYRSGFRIHAGFKWHVAQLHTKREVLEWYLAINAGGTPHTKGELDKVRKMLGATRKDEP